MINQTLTEPLDLQTLPQSYQALSDQNILVTGAAGFIGGDLFRRLCEYSLNVVGTVLYPEEAQELEALGYKAKVLDLASDQDFKSLLKGIDIVFNIYMCNFNAYHMRFCCFMISVFACVAIGVNRCFFHYYYTYHCIFIKL